MGSVGDYLLVEGPLFSRGVCPWRYRGQRFTDGEGQKILHSKKSSIRHWDIILIVVKPGKEPFSPNNRLV